MKKHIPNIITSGNIFCGIIGVAYAFENDYYNAMVMIWFAGLFDFFDGFAARLLKVTSNIGKDLDSLADMVTFGALPGFILYQIIPDYKFIAALIPIASAWRLAKFNNDSRQSDQFIGVPTPANALFISSLVYIAQSSESSLLNSLTNLIFSNPLFSFLLIIILSYLLLAELPLLALKFKNWSIKDNLLKYLLILGAILLIVLLNINAIPLIFIWYLILSMVAHFILKK